jgi:hypothetical protein
MKILFIGLYNILNHNFIVTFIRIGKEETLFLNTVSISNSSGKNSSPVLR